MAGQQVSTAAGANTKAMGTHSATAGEGAPAPDFELPDADGRPFRLSEALAQRPVVLVFLRGFA